MVLVICPRALTCDAVFGEGHNFVNPRGGVAAAGSRGSDNRHQALSVVRDQEAMVEGR
jgi:hypothetical protein